jgi:hypothetical protein
VPIALERICARTIAIKPSERHATARKLADEIDAWLQARHRDARFIPRTATVLAVPALVLAVAGILWPLFPRSLQRSATGEINSTLAFRPPSERLAENRQAAGISQSGEARRAGELVAEAERNGWLIGSYNTKFYHRPNCPHVKLMTEHNVRSFKNEREAAADGRVPCDHFKSGRPG